MTSDSDRTPLGDSTPADDTAAFQRFARGDIPPAAQPGLLYRVFVGWWRKK